IHILCDKRRMYLFSKIAEEFLALYREHHRILMVTAISAVPLTEDQLKRLTVKLSGATQKKVTLQNQVDPTIIGGIVLQYDHKEIDGSVKEKLERLRQQIRTVIV
ncbi:MAG: ATP synthase F1 subunit delta, partial [Oscillospiraceae bacterium]